MRSSNVRSELADGGWQGGARAQKKRRCSAQRKGLERVIAKNGYLNTKSFSASILRSGVFRLVRLSLAQGRSPHHNSSPTQTTPEPKRIRIAARKGSSAFRKLSSRSRSGQSDHSEIRGGLCAKTFLGSPHSSQIPAKWPRFRKPFPPSHLNPPPPKLLEAAKDVFLGT